MFILQAFIPANSTMDQLADSFSRWTIAIPPFHCAILPVALAGPKRVL